MKGCGRVALLAIALPSLGIAQSDKDGGAVFITSAQGDCFVADPAQKAVRPARVGDRIERTELVSCNWRGQLKVSPTAAADSESFAVSERWLFISAAVILKPGDPNQVEAIRQAEMSKSLMGGMSGALAGAAAGRMNGAGKYSEVVSKADALHRQNSHGFSGSPIANITLNPNAERELKVYAFADTSTPSVITLNPDDAISSAYEKSGAFYLIRIDGVPRWVNLDSIVAVTPVSPPIQTATAADAQPVGEEKQGPQRPEPVAVPSPGQPPGIGKELEPRL